MCVKDKHRKHKVTCRDTTVSNIDYARDGKLVKYEARLALNLLAEYNIGNRKVKRVCRDCKFDKKLCQRSNIGSTLVSGIESLF